MYKNPTFCKSNGGYNIMSEKEEYEVDAVIGERKRNGRTEYLIRWRGYSESDATWESETSLENAADAIKIFHERGVISRPKVRKILEVAKRDGVVYYTVLLAGMQEVRQIASEDLRPEYSNLILDYYSRNMIFEEGEMGSASSPKVNNATPSHEGDDDEKVEGVEDEKPAELVNDKE